MNKRERTRVPTDPNSHIMHRLAQSARLSLHMLRFRVRSQVFSYCLAVNRAALAVHYLLPGFFRV